MIFYGQSTTYTVTNGIVKNRRPKNSGTGTEMEPKWNQNRNRKNPSYNHIREFCGMVIDLRTLINVSRTIISGRKLILLGDIPLLGSLTPNGLDFTYDIKSHNNKI